MRLMLQTPVRATIQSDLGFLQLETDRNLPIRINEVMCLHLFRSSIPSLVSCGNTRDGEIYAAPALKTSPCAPKTVGHCVAYVANLLYGKAHYVRAASCLKLTVQLHTVAILY